MIKATVAVFLAALLLCVSQCRSLKEKDANSLFTPQEAIADFTIEAGFEVQPVVTEPLVEDPVALHFDEDGGMWVVEMRGYMQDKEGTGENLPLGRIKLLQDKNGDGRYETAGLFLDSLVMPRAVAVVNGGLLLIEPPGLYFVENRGGTAGKRIVIDSVFADVGNAEHQPNGLVRALDNWIYCAKSNKRVRFINNKWVIEKTQFRGQWGLSQDDRGRLFYNDNSTTLLGDAFLPNTFGVNEAYKQQSKKSYGAQLVSNRVFPARHTLGVNRGYEPGTLDTNGKLVHVTSACGPVIYRGDAFPEQYRGNAFVMEPAAYLIKRLILSEDSSGFVQGSFAHDSTEFLTATDERFRPVSGYTAPDGTLYFIDMHRGVIQHTTYLTPYLRRYIDSLKLERPTGMGRIYRIKWKEQALSKTFPLSPLSPSELANLLQHKNGWYRDMAQRLLIEHADTSVVSQLKGLALQPDAITALHALYTLEGLQALTPPFLQQVAQGTASKPLYQSCMKLLEGFPAERAALDILKTLAAKEDRFVALQFANSLTYFEKAFPKEVKTLLLQQVKKQRNDTLFMDAFISSAAGKEKSRLSWFSGNSSTDTTLRKALVAVIAKRKQARANPVASLTKQEAELWHSGQTAYNKFCATCHSQTGEGIQNVAPPLAGSQWVTGKDLSIPIRILLDGLRGPVDVGGKRYAPPEYNGTMPGLRNTIEINNGTLAAVLTYIRNAWGNKATAVTVQNVADIRKKTEQRQQPYTAEELQSETSPVAARDISTKK
jgi:glucose/arabinose dehydrogenase/mono/diheme cytochrome c family protein